MCRLARLLIGFSITIALVLLSFTTLTAQEAARPPITVENATQVTQLEVFELGQGYLLSPDGNTLAFKQADGFGRLRNLASGTEVAFGSDAVFGMEFSPNSVLLAAVIRGDGNRFRVWDVASGEERYVIQFSEAGEYVREWAFSSDSKKFAAVIEGAGLAQVWDMTSGEELYSLESYAIAFSPDGTLLASANVDEGTIELIDPASGETLHTFQNPNQPAPAFDQLVFSPTGTVLTSRSSDNSIRLWDVASGQELYSLETNTPYAPPNVAFSPDGTKLITYGEAETFKVWDVVSGGLLFDLEGPRGWERSARFSPDGTLFAVAGDYGALTLWDATSGTELQNLVGHSTEFGPGGLQSVRFSSDGTLLYSVAGYDMRIWGIADE